MVRAKTEYCCIPVSINPQRPLCKRFTTYLHLQLHAAAPLTSTIPLSLTCQSFTCHSPFAAQAVPRSPWPSGTNVNVKMDPSASRSFSTRVRNSAAGWERNGSMGLWTRGMSEGRGGG